MRLIEQLFAAWIFKWCLNFDRIYWFVDVVVAVVVKAFAFVCWNLMEHQRKGKTVQLTASMWMKREKMLENCAWQYYFKNKLNRRASISIRRVGNFFFAVEKAFMRAKAKALFMQRWLFRSISQRNDIKMHRRHRQRKLDVCAKYRRKKNLYKL